MGNPSLISSSLQVDPPLQLGASWRAANSGVDPNDRQYIDNQIRGCQAHLSNLLINGVVGTWRVVDPSSAAVAPGDVLATASSALGTVTRAVAGALLSNAGTIYGVAITGGSPGAPIQVALAGMLSPAITGLSASSGYAILNTTTGRIQLAASISSSNYPLGYIDGAGWLNLCPFLNVASAPAAWDPTSLSGLAAWYRGDSYNGTTGVWTDKSGNARTATSGTNKPVLSATDSSYNNTPTVAFTAASSMFFSTSSFTTITQTTTAWVVGEGSAGTFFDGIDATNRQVLFLSSGVWTMYSGTLLASTNNTTGKHLWIVKFKGASSTMAIDVKTPPGSAGTTGVTGNAGTAGIAGFMIGAQEPPGAPGSFLQGKIAEFGLQAGDMSTSDIASLASYVSTRYGITVGA